MPVSKKRKKKDGKPVHRSQPAAPAASEGAQPPDEKPPTHPDQRMGRPRNPFVAQQQQQTKRGAQRGR